MMELKIAPERSDAGMIELSSAEVDGVAGGMSVQRWVARTVWMVDQIVNQGATCTIDADNTITCYGPYTK
jgi:hypothetical protein